MRVPHPRCRLSFPSQSHNLHTLRSQPIAEVSGALGDLGTLLPILVALTLTSSISLSSTLVFTGLANILTGLFFGIPLPVQPMKAIAAVAISRKFSQEETASAGLFVAAVIGGFSVTGLLDWIGRIVPIPVVKGIQVGAGLSLVLSAGQSLLQPLGWLTPSVGDNLLWALGALIFLLATYATTSRRDGISRIPYALITFLIGLVIAILAISKTSQTGSYDHNDHASQPLFALWRPSALHITTDNFRTGSLTAGVGQLPLTTLNSIIAVTHLSHELLPALPAPQPSALGFSITLVNLLGCPFGAMPACHGSGGLAGQHRFGARSGASIIMLGLTKLVLGLCFNGKLLVSVLERFPKAILGIMVLAAGVELAKVGEGLNNEGARDMWEKASTQETTSDDLLAEEQSSSGAQKTDGGKDARTVKILDPQERKQRWMVMMITIAGLLAFKNDAVGFLAGLAAHMSARIPELSNRWDRSSRHSLRRDDDERTGLLEA